VSNGVKSAGPVAIATAEAPGTVDTEMGAEEAR
jgi:hypothetical protein